MTLFRVAAETLAPVVKVRDTAERDTPALSATSFALTTAFSIAIITPARFVLRMSLSHFARLCNYFCSVIVSFL